MRDFKRLPGTLAISLSLCCSITAGLAQTNYQQLKSFGSPTTDGSQPNSALMEGSDGVLYGVTSAGGANSGGTVFRLNRDGSGYTVLHSFTNTPYPYGGLVEAEDRMLYGTRSGGGTGGLGFIFRLNKDGSNYLVLHNFAGTGAGSDGSTPSAVLIARNGLLYGTTQYGGATNLGTVFAVQTNGTDFMILHSFMGTNSGDGSVPFANLLQGSDGALYGTTQSGGIHDQGIVFRLETSGSNYTVLHAFSGAGPLGDGDDPLADLVQGNDGALYGTTLFGGSNNWGVVFRINPDGSDYTVLHHFGSAVDGKSPWGGLVLGNDGLLRGTTRLGGLNGVGTIFALSTNASSYSVLYSFSTTGNNGYQPETRLLAGSDGDWYGTTLFGGTAGSGTLFKLFASPPRITISRIQRTGSGTLLSFAGGAANQLYQVQATTNLSNPNAWLPIGSTNAAIDGTFQFLDAETTSYPRRFYRSVMP